MIITRYLQELSEKGVVGWIVATAGGIVAIIFSFVKMRSTTIGNMKIIIDSYVESHKEKDRRIKELEEENNKLKNKKS